MDVSQIWKLIVRYSCQVRNASDCLHSKMLILFRISEVVPKIRGIKMKFDGSHITICNMFNAHRTSHITFYTSHIALHTSHIAFRTSYIHMLMFINMYACCHEVYLSNEVARWNQSAHCQCNGKGIKGKILNRNNVVFWIRIGLLEMHTKSATTSTSLSYTDIREQTKLLSIMHFSAI